MRESTANVISGAQVAWASMLAFLPKLALFLVILVAGYFIAKWVGKLVNNILERVGFDNLVERGGIKRALAKTKWDASDIMCKLAFYTLFLLVLQLAFGVFGPNPVSDILTQVIAFLPTLFVSLLIIVVAAAIAKGVKEILNVALANFGYGRMLATIASATVVIVGVFAALSHLQIAPAIVNGLFYAGLAIVAGSAIVAIGGGGIIPMRHQWEKALGKVESEAPRVKMETTHAKEHVKTYVEARKEEIKGEMQQAKAEAQSQMPVEEHHEEHPMVEEKPRFETRHL